MKKKKEYVDHWLLVGNDPESKKQNKRKIFKYLCIALGCVGGAVASGFMQTIPNIGNWGMMASMLVGAGSLAGFTQSMQHAGYIIKDMRIQKGIEKCIKAKCKKRKITKRELEEHKEIYQKIDPVTVEIWTRKSKEEYMVGESYVED